MKGDISVLVCVRGKSLIDIHDNVCTDTSTLRLNVCAFLPALFPVLVSPQASVNDPLFPQRSTNRFPRDAAHFQPGPDPHLDQLESICYCKYKFGNL